MIFFLFLLVIEEHIGNTITSPISNSNKSKSPDTNAVKAKNITNPSLKIENQSNSIKVGKIGTESHINSRKLVENLKASENKIINTTASIGSKPFSKPEKTEELSNKIRQTESEQHTNTKINNSSTLPSINHEEKRKNMSDNARKNESLTKSVKIKTSQAYSSLPTQSSKIATQQSEKSKIEKTTENRTNKIEESYNNHTITSTQHILLTATPTPTSTKAPTPIQTKDTTSIYYQPTINNNNKINTFSSTKKQVEITATPEIGCIGPNTFRSRSKCICKEGFIGDSPVGERGCWKCDHGCSSQATCEYPGKCICKRGMIEENGNCVADKAELISILSTEHSEIPYYVRASYKKTDFIPYSAYCKFDSVIVTGMIDHSEGIVSCLLPKDILSNSKFSISFDKTKWSNTLEFIYQENLPKIPPMQTLKYANVIPQRKIVPQSPPRKSNRGAIIIGLILIICVIVYMYFFTTKKNRSDEPGIVQMYGYNPNTAEKARGARKKDEGIL